MTDVKRIESYSLYEFCQQVEESIKDGYSFDFDSNENFPQNYGTLLTCGLVKSTGEKEVETEDETEVTEIVTETEQVAETIQDDEQSTETSNEQTEVEDAEVNTEDQTETEVTEETNTPAKRGPKPKAK